jgi:Holliday junction resolvasome RuvABC ATP-dependent DNA helicase subunit
MITQKFGGGPVGLDTLSTAIGEDRGTLEDMIEPYLIQKSTLFCKKNTKKCFFTTKSKNNDC